MIDASGDQTNINIIEKYCYDNNASNCDTYGGMYVWDEMMQYLTTESTQGCFIKMSSLNSWTMEIFGQQAKLAIPRFGTIAACGTIVHKWKGMAPLSSEV